MEKTLLIKTEFAGDVTVQWDAIVGIQSTQDLHLDAKGREEASRENHDDGRKVRGRGRTGSRGQGHDRGGAE